MTNSSDERRHTGDPFLAAVEERLRKGTYLKGDDRPLERILQEDAAEVNRLGMDLERITDEMNRLYDQGRKGMGDPVLVDEKYETAVREDRGILASPWLGDQHAAPKAIVEVTNIKNGRTISYSMLAWFLIREHGFFQGKGSPFRVEPSDLREFFLEP